MNSLLTEQQKCATLNLKNYLRKGIDFMSNGQYFMPVQIVAGEDCVKNNAGLFVRYGMRALIVTGKSSAMNGALEDVIFSLTRNTQKFTIFDQIPANPTVACVEEGAKIAREFRADFVIAIGGGSPMDAAKAIAMLARQNARENIFLHAITEDVLPMVHIPTTAGTGSEVTPYAILTNDEKQTKTSISAPSLFPKLAFLDGKYMASLPQSITVNTAIDAISHAVEGMLSIRAGFLSDILARESLQLLLGEYDAMFRGEYTVQSRKNLLYGATLAGMVIANTGTSPVHGMGYSLTYFHGVPHGRANGLLLPAFLELCLEKIPQRTAEVYRAIGLSPKEFSEKIALLLGEREAYNDACLRDYAARAARNKNIRNCQAYFSEADLYTVLRRSLGE